MTYGTRRFNPLVCTILTKRLKLFYRSNDGSICWNLILIRYDSYWRSQVSSMGLTLSSTVLWKEYGRYYSWKVRCRERPVMKTLFVFVIDVYREILPSPVARHIVCSNAIHVQSTMNSICEASLPAYSISCFNTETCVWDQLVGLFIGRPDHQTTYLFVKIYLIEANNSYLTNSTMRNFIVCTVHLIYSGWFNLEHWDEPDM
jgi:hypothetical protein